MSIEQRIEKAWYLEELLPEQHSGTSLTDFRAGFLAGRVDAIGKEVGAEELEHGKTYFCQWPSGEWTACEASVGT